MKSLTILLLTGLCANVFGYLIKVPSTPANPRIAPLGWVNIQKLMLPLFDNICEESSDPTIVKLSNEFTFDASDYWKTDVIEKLQNFRSDKGLLSKGEIFSETIVDHFNEFHLVYDVLFNAKDFDTFYKAASWTRQNVNCGIFINAIYLAIMTRKDTEKLSVPAPYELLPNYFIRKDFIIRAASLISENNISLNDIREEGNTFIVDANYTDFESSKEAILSYFHEDIGLNSYYFLTALKIMPWVDTEFQRSIRYGEHIYHFLKQLITRYDLERYSNDLYETDGINWDDMDVTQYDPMLIYSNGDAFRSTYVMSNNDVITSLKNMENNIINTVTHLRDGGFNKPAIIRHVMDIMLFNDNSYIKLALQAIGEDATANSSLSVLNHYMTKLRHPMFWRILKKMVETVSNALKILPGYNKNQLYFPGVQITNVDVKKMMTSFDSYDIDVTDALKYGDKDPNFQIKISQSRLNHKPFTVKVNISSMVVQKGILKLYLGPKITPGEKRENKNLFMLIDSFEINLKRGSNLITRSSNEIIDLSDDFVPLRTVHKNVIDSEFGVDALTLKSVISQIGFPSRLLLPKGNSEGLPFQLFVFVAPYIKAIAGGSKSNIQLNHDAIFSPGYPFDLDIEIQELFNLPNALVKDIAITHKVESKPGNYGGESGGYNREKKWNAVDDNIRDYELASNLLGAGTRPEFTKKKDTFDYKSRKGQYGKEDKYSIDIVNSKIPEETEEFRKDVEFKKVYAKNDENSDHIRDKVISKKNDNMAIDKIITKDKQIDQGKEEDLKHITTDLDKTIDDFVKEIDLKVEPIYLLSSPIKRFPTMFNIILKPPYKETESDERVYE